MYMSNCEIIRVLVFRYQYKGEYMGMKKAFTLAEVLITLGIIGVVAALTLPVLINKYQEHVTVNKFKKFYSIMSQAILMSINKSGYPNEWSVAGSAESGSGTEQSAKDFAKYLKPHLKIVEDCGTKTGCLGYTEKVKTLNGNEHVNYDTYSNRIYYKLVLSDGSCTWFRVPSPYCISADECAVLFYDTNCNKLPNTIGRDIFTFDLRSNGKFLPIKDDTSDCKLTGGGWSCGLYILRNNNMDYLH